MLRMDDIKYIKRMFENEGVSIREIIRRTGYHYETVKKYLEMDDFNEPHYPPKDVPSLLDPLKPVIDKWLENDLKAPRKQRHTAKRVCDRLKEEYPEQLEVKLRTIQYYVSKKRKELYEERNKGYLPLRHPEGEAQVDFCKISYYDNAGIMQEARKLTMSFPYSNAAYCQIFKGENMECLLQGIKNIMEYIGYVPYRMVFDNLSAAVVHINKDKTRNLTDGFKRFATHYHIDTVFCNPAAGWEKGNVEGKVGYERRNMFVPVPTILDIDQFNKRLFGVCNKDMQRVHYEKNLFISELFEGDKRAMLPLPENSFHVAKMEVVKSDKYGKVMFESNRYSTSPKLALTTVYLEVSSDMVEVMNEQYQIVVCHPRLYGKGKESMNWLPYISLMSKRPNALKYTGFYHELPDVWRTYLNDADPKTKREALLALNVILQKHDIATAADALNVALANQVKDAASIIASYQRLTSNTPHLPPVKLGNNIIDMPVFKADTNRYDDLLGKKVAK